MTATNPRELADNAVNKNCKRKHARRNGNGQYKIGGKQCFGHSPSL